jgi:hypothetical protein
MLNALNSEEQLLVAASEIISGTHTLNVNQSALLMLSVPGTRHASTNTAVTHVLECAEFMQVAVFQIMHLSAAVILATQEMLSLPVSV